MKKFIIFIVLLIALLVTIGALFYYEIVPQFKTQSKTNVDLSDIYFIKNDETNEDEYEILGDSDFSGDYDSIYEEEFSGDEIIFEEVFEETSTPTPVSTKATTTKATTSNNSSTPATSKPVVSSSPYYIKVNRTQNTVNIYQKDEEGSYTVPAKAMVCSIGTSTPKAGSKYKITSYRRAWNGLKGNVYGQYAVQIVGNILFHSVPYTAKSNDTLEYWEYDKLGTQASLGCIRLAVKDAKWIYDNVPAGTYVEFYEDDNPGPFGKPIAQKISDNELCRNWDPTDYVEGNPWHNGTSIETIEPTTTEIIPSGNQTSSEIETTTNTEPTPEPTTSINVEATPAPTPTENVVNENVEIVPIEELIKSTPRPTSVRKYNKSTPAPTRTPIEVTPEPIVNETVPSAESNEESSNETTLEETTTDESTATEETTTNEPATTETTETTPPVETPSQEQSNESEFKLTDTPIWSIE